MADFPYSPHSTSTAMAPVLVGMDSKSSEFWNLGGFSSMLILDENGQFLDHVIPASTAVSYDLAAGTWEVYCPNIASDPSLLHGGVSAYGLLTTSITTKVYADLAPDGTLRSGIVWAADEVKPITISGGKPRLWLAHGYAGSLTFIVRKVSIT